MRRLALAALVACVFVTLMSEVLAERVCYFSQEPDARQPGRLRWFMPGSKEDRCACTSTRPGSVYMQPLHWSHPPFYTDTPIFTNDPEDIHDYFNCHGDSSCSVEGPLGMEDGRIPDERITASSFWQNRADHAPPRARLNIQGYAAAWCNEETTDNISPWIQVDFVDTVTITGLITQGRGDNDQRVTEYQVTYSDDGQSWHHVTDADGTTMKFPGNKDRNTLVTTRLPFALRTRILRIHPTAWNLYCSMRFEVIGCY
ncbi:retinoschisin-like [Patiria miniata]|uniref:F5/8 type C domain-containing protein n=1 Tax=Patiria miniata TaxID=46514 RepID=A0A914A9G7_PATMI|nr:retinoschisin-like [Patiria miniata]